MEYKNAIVFEPNTWYKAKKSWYSLRRFDKFGNPLVDFFLLAGSYYKTNSDCLLKFENGELLDTPYDVKTGPSKYLEKVSNDDEGLILFLAGYKRTEEKDMYLVPGGKVDKQEALSRIKDDLQLACIPIGSLIVPPNMVQEWAEKIVRKTHNIKLKMR